MSRRRPQAIPESERGAAMLAALCLAMVLAICLSSYIALCYTTLKMSTRNLMGTHCIELAETGLERALYSQNNWDWSAPWNVHAAIATANATLPTFQFENGATGQVSVLVVENSPKANWAQITSSGTVTLPDGTSVKRTLQCVCQPMSGFVNAAAATAGKVTFTNGGLLDSYDSTQAPYQPGGYSAFVVSAASPPLYPTVLLNTAVVDGFAEGTGSNSVSYSSSAKVVGPNTPNGVNIDPSRVLTSSQIFQPTLPENLPTFGASVPSITTSMSLGTPGATVPTVIYVTTGDVNLSGGAQLQINGPVILDITAGNLSVTNSAQIVIASTKPPAQGGGGPNVSLEIHLEKGNMNLDGGGIVNGTMIPERLAIVGTKPTSRTIEIGTTNPFFGVVYFPNAPLIVSNNATIYGSLVANSITFNPYDGGSPAIHYDMSLRSPSGLVGDAAFTSVEAPQPVGASPPGQVVAPVTVVPGTLVEVPAQ